jgi:hypothetical protein
VGTHAPLQPRLVPEEDDRVNNSTGLFEFGDANTKKPPIQATIPLNVVENNTNDDDGTDGGARKTHKDTDNFLVRRTG